MTTTQTPTRDVRAIEEKPRSAFGRFWRFLLTERLALLSALLVIVVVWFWILGATGYLVAPYSPEYLISSLESMVPLCCLAIAELFVILSGRGGIDLSVGAIVSLTGMSYGFMVGPWGWPLLLAIPAAIVLGTALGAVNGALVAYLGFPALIATLATSYAYSSIALVMTPSTSISDKGVIDSHVLTKAIPLFDGIALPLQVLTFMIPVIVLAWIGLNRTTWGRSMYAVGTNDIAATYATQPVKRTRFSAYAAAGLISGIVAVVNVAQFASARADAGTSGNGMALPAITIAVLGGVAIAGGVGKVGGVVMAALLVTWLNAGILLAFEGSDGSRYQLLALGIVLIAAVLLNTFSQRRIIRR